MSLRIHDILEFSGANGPGSRFVIFFQGCTLGCPNCINPRTHDVNGGRVELIKDVVDRIRERACSIEGITISGGEPFLQPIALKSICTEAKEMGLGTIVSTGFTIAELSSNVSNVEDLFHSIDALVAGRFHQEDALPTGLVGSHNKQIVLFSNRYSLDDIFSTARLEIDINDSMLKASGTGVYDLFDWNTFI